MFLTATESNSNESYNGLTKLLSGFTTEDNLCTSVLTIVRFKDSSHLVQAGENVASNLF